MNDTATRSQRRFARLYGPMAQKSEDAGLGEIRAALLAKARGRTLDIGTGTGLTVRHYPPAVTELVMLEPSPAMREQLQSATSWIRARAWSIVDGDAGALPFEDASFDTVTTGLVFCSLPDPEAALREVARVLRPGGRFLFMEHVRGSGVRRFFQEVTLPLQVLLADGCHPNRDFVGMVERSPLETTEVTRTTMPKAFPTVSPMVVGVATRPQ